MTEISSEQKEEDICVLERRVRELERCVCDTASAGSFAQATLGVTGLSVKVTSLLARFAQIEKDNEDIKEVCAKYDEYQRFLDRQLTERPGASAAEKKSILLSAFDDITGMSVLLSEFDELKAVADLRPPIKDIRAVDALVTKAEFDTQQILADTLVFKKALETFLTNYNDLVYLVSQKFLAWNDVLSAIEDKVRADERDAHFAKPKTFTSTDSSFAG